MPSFFKQFGEIWSRFKPAQRVAVVGAAVLTLAFMGALVYYGSRSDYGVLFSDLKPEDAQMIVERLKTDNVPYQLTQGGTTVLVPQERVTELRLQLAASGALSGGHVGFDIFDKNSFGATDFAQQVNYQRAIEGELARTLEAMDEVESARIHITRPKESLFADKEQRAKASVMLRVRQGREMSRERVAATVSLVASAVEGLDPVDISVMDTRGRLLSAPSSGIDGIGGDSASFNSHLEARRRLEAESAARIVALLEPVTGANHARADVAAELDFSSVEQTEEKYDPKSAVIRSQQTAQEARNTTQGGQGGIAGARANDPATPTAPAAAAPSTTGDQRNATTTNYEIDKIVRRTTGGGGRLTRLSVSVVVDYKTTNGVAAARTPEELQKIQELVAAAVGISNERGDRIVVQTMPFDQPTIEETTPTFVERYRDLINTAIKYGMLLFAALLLLLFVVRPVKRLLRTTVSPFEPQLLPAGGADLALAAATNRSADGVEQLPGVIASQQALGDGTSGEDTLNITSGRSVAELEAEMDEHVAREIASSAPIVRRATAIKKQLLERTQTDPELIAMTLRSWLQEPNK